jgi:hypothetical protein
VGRPCFLIKKVPRNISPVVMAKFWSEDEGPPHVVGRLLQDDELKPRGIDIYSLYRK